MNVTDNLEIDLTQAIANKGKAVHFESCYTPSDSLLEYPNACFTYCFVSLDVVSNGYNVDIDGKIAVKVQGVCDRCCEQTEKTFELPFEQSFFKDSDDAEYTYTGSKVNVSKAVDDEIMLNLPISFICSQNCKGLCAVCGANLNKTTCDCVVEKENVFSVLKNLKF